MSMLPGVCRKAWRMPWIFCVLAVLGSCTPPSQSNGGTVPVTAVDGPYVPGELLVQFRTGIAHERMLEILSVNGLRIERELGIPRAFLVRTADSRTVQEIIVRLRSYPEIESAEPNRLRRIGPPLPPPVKPAPNG
jgi:hypothetical protein